MLFAEVAATSTVVTATRSRLAKVDALAALLDRTRPELVPAVTGMLAGALRQGRVGVGYAVLRASGGVPPAAAPDLTVAEFDAAVDELAALCGPGSAMRRAAVVRSLLARCDSAGQRLLRGLLGGEVRQGAQESLLLDAVARVAGVPGAVARRALMLSGDLSVTASAALADPRTAAADRLAAFRLRVGRPVRPMLASPAGSVAEALGDPPRTVSVEHKLDGARIQVHRDGDIVSVYTRTLNEVTARVPDLVALVRSMPCRTVVLDGETLTLSDNGRPRPFQETMARFGTRAGVRPPVPQSAAEPGSAPDPAQVLRPFFFDCLHLDGADLLDEPLHRRRAALVRVAGDLVVPGTVTDDPAAAADVLAASLAAGHEGVVVKDLDSGYAAGRRGAAWRKVKPVATLDLVVLAVEPGSGRRTGTLSNLHLGARDPAGGPPVMVGKTFKGLTDELLEWQTARLRELAVGETGETGRTGETAETGKTRGVAGGAAGAETSGPADVAWVVRVRPELVVEIALDGAQASSRYPGGVALRFARVVRYRPDKEAAQADTIDAVRALLDRSGG